jgi:hypothetical protein
VIGAADMPSRFLGEAPPEIRDVLDWFNVGQAREIPSPRLAEFAERFLGAMHDDGAVLPEITPDSAPQTLALVLLHHTKSPESAGTWINLGFALRRMALYRNQDPEQVNRLRLRRASEALERSIQLDPDNIGKNIRAWTGEAFVYHALGRMKTSYGVVRAHWRPIDQIQNFGCFMDSLSVLLAEEERPSPPWMMLIRPTSRLESQKS